MRGHGTGSEIRDGWVRLSARPLHYAEAGEGPAVVVAAGLGLSTRFYEPAMSAFARAGVRLIVPDLPGWGRTAGPATGCSIVDMAGLMIEFADAIGLARPGWLGHSIGAQVVLEIAATSPARAAALALAAPTGAPVRHRLLWQASVFVWAALHEPPSLLLAVVRDYIRVLPIAYLGSWLRAGADRPMEKLERIGCPVLVVLGERDPVPHPRLLALLRDRLPDGRVVRVPGGGHGAPRDAVQAFTAVAAPFFRAHRGPARDPLEGGVA